MASFNLLQCQSRAGNTGIGRCTQSNAVEVGGFFIPKGDVITAANAADLKAFIASKVHADTYAQRWHPVGKWVDVIPEDSEEQMTDYADGSKTINRDAYYSTRYRHTQGDCFQSSLRQFAGREGQFDYIAVDKLGRLVVVNKTDVNGVAVLGGAALSRIYVPNKGKATYSEAGMYALVLDFADASEYNEQYATLQAQDTTGKNFNPLAWAQSQAVQDVFISPSAPGLVAGVVTLLFGTGCGQESLGSTYALTAGMLTVRNKQTGAAITVTSLAASPAGNGQYVLTLDTTDTDYPASGLFLTVQMIGVAALAALGPAYYESNTLTLKV